MGPGKEKARQEFQNVSLLYCVKLFIVKDHACLLKEIEDDRLRYETQLRALKDYDERTQKMMEENHKQQLISIEQQVNLHIILTCMLYIHTYICTVEPL